MLKAKKAFDSYKFLPWLDDFIQSRQDRNNLPQIQLPRSIDSLNQFPDNESYERGEQTRESENGDQDFRKSEEIKCNKKPMDNRKRKLNESSKSALLENMEFSICSDIRDMVKLRNEKSRPVLEEESEEELFGRTLAFELKQLPQYEKVMAKHELRSVMFKYQMIAIQKNMGNEIHSPQSNVNYINFVSPPPTHNWYPPASYRRIVNNSQ